MTTDHGSSPTGCAGTLSACEHNAPKKCVPEHWHFERNTDEDAETAHTSLYHALSTAQEEIDELLEWEIQGITAMGDAGDFEGAYRAYQTSEAYGNVRDNIANILRNHLLSPNSSERAPLYQTDWEHGTPEEADARLLKSAEHTMEMVNSDTPLYIWHCTFSDVIVVTEDMLDESGELRDSDIEDFPLYM